MKRVVLFVAIAVAVIHTSAQQPATGSPMYGSFDTFGTAQINLQNLNYHISVPITVLNGRQLAPSFELSYDSSIWTNLGSSWTPRTNSAGSSTWGWVNNNVSGLIQYTHSTAHCPGDPVGLNLGATHYSNFTFVTSDGTSHPFSVSFSIAGDDCGTTNGSTTGYATDNSGYFLDGSAINVWDRSGIRSAGDTRLEDTNGNFLSGTTNVSIPTEFDWTDTVGRLALKITSTSGIPTQFQYLNPSGGYETVSITNEVLNIKTNFACSGVVEYTGTATVPQYINLPNGQKYSLTYEGTPGHSGYYTGRISSIGLPTGGTMGFSYTGSNGGINCSDGSTTGLQIVANDGTNSPTKTYVRAPSGANWVTTLTNPMMPYDTVANQSAITFNATGQEISRKIYQGTATLLQTINTTWAANNTPATKITILDDNSTQSEIETQYDNYGNLLSEKEHDFGTGIPGATLRSTVYTYLSTLTAQHILDRVTDKSVSDSTGTVKYREDIAYDGTTLGPCPSGALQHDTTYGCTFTTRGNPTTFTVYTNASTPSGGIAKNSYYDIFGNRIKADDDTSQTISWNFSATTQYSAPDSVVRGPSGTQLTANFTYNAYTGGLASITNPNSELTSFAYDSFGRQTVTTRPDSAVITESYDDVGHTSSTSEPIQGTSLAKTTRSEDGFGNIVQESLFDAGGTSYATTQYMFDGLGRLYKTSNPFTGSALYWTQTTFDALGRTKSIVLQDGESVGYVYAGSSTVETDAAGHQRKLLSDGLGRISTVFEPDPSSGNSLTLQTTYSYSVLDGLLTVTQGAQSRTFSYDGIGRVAGKTLPETGATSYQYNNFHLLTQRTDARGVITTYSYDNLNRPYQISYNVGTSGVTPTPSVTYSFGTNSAQHNNGRLLTLTDGMGTVTHSYDNLGRTTQVQHVISGSTYTIGYQFNLAGKVTSTTYPSNRVVQQSYDAIGRLASVSSGTTTYANTFTYNSSTYPTSFKHGNGVTATIGYSPDRLQLLSLSYIGTSTMFSLNYNHAQSGGNNGQIAGVTDAVDAGRSVAYTYDSLNRIATAVSTGSSAYPKWGLSFTYDRYGNRTNQTVTAGTAVANSVTVNPANNHITTAGYSYDLNGNLTSDGMNTLVYDAENRLLSSSGSLGSGTYSYRASGVRAVKTSGGNTIVSIFDGDHNIAEYNNGTLLNEYVYMGRQLIATHASGVLYYAVSDHQSVRVLADATGSIAGQKGHYPFGEDWYMTPLTNRHFTTYARDSESANDNALQRFYINRLGRFSASDPVPGGGNTPQALNLFSYGRNDVVNRVDPDGRWSLPCWLFDIACDPGEGGGDDGGGGGGGGGSGCNDPAILESTSCPPNPEPPPPPDTTPCLCQMRHRTVDEIIAKIFHAQHNFWYLETSDAGKVFWEAGPTNGKLVENPIPIQIAGPLQKNAAASFTRGPSAEFCNKAENIDLAGVLYNNFENYSPIKGPNSNSSAHYLARIGNFHPHPPFPSPGWNHPVNQGITF